tara:strand:+ start:678 stop:1133 length:456 start_codon:yes stop_codon:yes gene_type:complete
MLKNTIKYIFIYTICLISIGCESNLFGPNDGCEECHLELEAPNLPLDENGIYHLDYIDGDLQTFTQLRAYVGYGMEYLGWESDTEYCVQMWNYIECNDVVNPASYSGSDGYATQIMGVHQEHIGDTVTVYCGYYDNYGKQYLNSIRIKIDE